MGRDIKYIGMDVHKEAIVIAVRNTRGHVVMEAAFPPHSPRTVFCLYSIDS